MRFESHAHHSSGNPGEPGAKCGDKKFFVGADYKDVWLDSPELDGQADGMRHHRVTADDAAARSDARCLRALKHCVAIAQQHDIVAAVTESRHQSNDGSLLPAPDTRTYVNRYPQDSSSILGRWTRKPLSEVVTCEDISDIISSGPLAIYRSYYLSGVSQCDTVIAGLTAGRFRCGRRTSDSTQGSSGQGEESRAAGHSEGLGCSIRVTSNS